MNVREALSVTHFDSNFCARLPSAPKAHRMHSIWLNTQPQCDSVFDTVYLFSSFIFVVFSPMCVSLCPLSPFIFRLQAQRERYEAVLYISIFSRSQHISGSINVWTATKYSVCLCTLDSLLHLFSDNQRKAIWEGNWTNDDHHTRWLPKIFWLLLMFVPFVHRIASNVLFSSVDCLHRLRNFFCHLFH